MDPASPFPAAVVVDLEGTLVETEPLWWHFERELVHHHGGRWTSELAYSLLGASMEQVGGRLYEAAGRPEDSSPVDLLEQVAERVAAEVRSDVQWRPGALEFLGMLATKHVRLAVVTPVARAVVDGVLSHLWDEMFGASVAAEEVRRPRPHPESYLLAAHKLGVRPSDCIAVDSWPAGLAAAEEAGFWTVGVPNHAAIPSVTGRLVTRSLADLDMRTLVGMARSGPWR